MAADNSGQERADVNAAKEATSDAMGDGTTTTPPPPKAKPAPKKSQWVAQIWMDLEPSFGSKTVSGRPAEYVDNAEYDVYLGLTTPALVDGQPIELEAGLTASPVLFGDQPAQSSWYGVAQFGTRRFYKGEFGGLDFAKVRSVGQTFTYYASARYQETYDDFFGTPEDHATIAHIGAEYGDLSSVVCDYERHSSLDRCADKDRQAGVSTAVGLNVGRTWAGDPDSSDTSAVGYARLVGPPVAGLFRPVAEANATRVWYTDALAPDGRLRRDWEYQVYGGIVLSPLLHKTNFSISSAVQYSRLTSNDVTKNDHETQFWIRLTYSFSRPLG